MHFTTAAIVLAAFASSAYAHMEMTSPIPFRSKLNKNTQNQDFSMTTPLSSSGSDFPCKGYLSDLGTPAGVSTATFAPGSAQKLSITGGAAHNGGSCQLSLSYDGGKTFKVIKSIEGGCVNPAGGEHSFDFTVPADAKAGDAVFAWTWFNNTGNREMYMNCAAVTISGSGTNDLSSNPDMFVANVGKDCSTPANTDLKFPNPGADVQSGSSAKLAPPEGDKCAAASGPPPAAAPPAAAPPATDESGATPPPPADEGDAAVPPADEGDAAVPPPAVAPPTGVPDKAAPPATGSGSSYTVKAGDICTTIAAQNGVTVEQLLKNNPTINSSCSNLVVGQAISLRRRSRIMREYY